MNSILRRRRAMMGAKSTPLEYVADGLGLHLDAIDNKGTEHDSTYYDWVDKINGYVFDQRPNGSEIAFEPKCFNFTGNIWFVRTTINLSWNTIEICGEFEETNTSTEVIFQTNNSGSLSTACLKAGNVLFGNGGVKSTKIVYGRHTYCYNGSKVYVDGVEAQTQNTTVSWGTNNTCIGAYASQSQYKLHGKIYSIRCYNRSLSEAEIANNAAVDAARFS